MDDRTIGLCLSIVLTHNQMKNTHDIFMFAMEFEQHSHHMMAQLLRSAA